MTREEIVEEIDRLYRIQNLYYLLLEDLGRMVKDAKTRQKPFLEIYEEVIHKYVIKIGRE